MNPHWKEAHYTYYLRDGRYTDHAWLDIGMWVEVGGLALIVCSIIVTSGRAGIIGFRLVDENDEPLAPYRVSTNNRSPTHFSAQPYPFSNEAFYVATFQMVVNCKYAKLQIYPDGSSNLGYYAFINSTDGYANTPDRTWHHKTISTMTAIPLVPHYQGGANTIFTYPQSRTPRAPDDDKPDIIYKDKISPSSSSGVPRQ